MLNLKKLYYSLLASVNLSTWWPADSRFEILLGVILTQNTAWKNVVASINNLRDYGLLDISNFLDCKKEIIEGLIRPSGFMKAKSACLLEIGRAFYLYDEIYKKYDYYKLRTELLKIKGIGVESADSICLYVYEHPCFIYDKYALRTLASAQLIPMELNYSQAKIFFDKFYYSSEFTLEEARKFHGLIVDANKEAQIWGRTVAGKDYIDSLYTGGIICDKSMPIFLDAKWGMKCIASYLKYKGII